MKNLIFILCVTFFLAWSGLAYSEDWKGTPEKIEGSFGALTGLGIVDGTGGFTIVGTVSKTIVHHGFVSDINDSVSVEAMFGPVFVNSSTAWMYAAQLRWDFEKDDHWIFYALGGLGGNFKNFNSNSQFEITPRFGAGTFFKITPQIRLRGEVAHDLIGVGVNIPF